GKEDILGTEGQVVRVIGPKLVRGTEIEAGFAEDATTHFVVQAHYLNPTHASGLTDSSGFDLCTTDQLRPNDADVLAFGTQNILLPAHTSVTLNCDVQVPFF